MEKWIKDEIVFSGRIFTVKSGDVLLDDGNSSQRDVVIHNGGVAIIPIVNNEVILINQFRISIGKNIVELPAGRLEKNEKPEDCAKRELEEEIGFQAKELILVHSYYSSVGFTDESMFIYLAVNPIKSKPMLEFDERIKIVKYPIAQIETMLMNKQFNDSKTIIGLYAMLSYLTTS